MRHRRDHRHGGNPAGAGSEQLRRGCPDHPPPSLENLAKEPEWVTIPATGVVAGRGTGALDLARCIRSGGRPIASGELGYHVLDTMIGMDEAMTLGQTVAVTSTVDPCR